MSITSLPKKAQRVARAKVLNKRTVREQENFKYAIKRLILKKLYHKQFLDWNEKLFELSNDNAISQGRANDGHIYAIYWNNRRYTLVTKSFEFVDKYAYCVPLNVRIKEYVDRMEEIAEEFDELWDEKYETERFIANLLTFEAPPERFEKILGATLYRAVQAPITKWFVNCNDTWNDNSEFSLRTFIESNQEIINKMNERIMLNIVT